MKYFLVTLLLMFAGLPGLRAQDTAIPPELEPFVYKGYEPLDFVKADLNGDKLMDYLLVLKIEGEDTMTWDNPTPETVRPLLLIIRQPDRSLMQQARNEALILCRQCGGVMGDPYQGLTTKPGEFTADFYGGSSWRWTARYTFRYDKTKKNWFLLTHSSSSFQSGDPDKTMKETTINRNEIGEISLEDFSPSYNSDSSSWKVNAVKTWFYNSPNLLSKAGKTYLVKGNTITSYKKYKNFIECSFTNSKGTTTHGFILRKDLILLSANTPKPVL